AVSVRIKNCITQEIGKGTFPFNTIGDYVRNGGVAALKDIPAFGKRTAGELEVLIHSVISGNELVEQSERTHLKNVELVTQLNEKYPMVFEPLLDAYRL